MRDDRELPLWVTQSSNPLLLMIAVLKKARRQGMRPMLREHAYLRFSHFSVGALLANRGPLSQKDVSACIGIDPSDLVDIIDKMEQVQLVQRVRDSSDRRRYNLHLTHKGMAYFSQRRVRNFQNSFFTVLTVDEQKQFIKLLRKLLRNNE